MLRRVGGDMNREKLAYFGHAAAFGFVTKSRQEMRANLGAALVRASPTTDNVDSGDDRVFDICTIVLTKYRRIRKAMQALCVSSLLFGLAMALEVPFGSPGRNHIPRTKR